MKSEKETPKVVFDHEENSYFRLSDEVCVLRDGNHQELRVEQEPVTLTLRGRCASTEDGRIILRIPRAAYDDDEVVQKLRALGQDLLTVLDRHGF